MKINLTNGAVLVLSEIIGMDGWAKGPRQFYQAGRFLAEILPPLTAPILTNQSTKKEVENAQSWPALAAPEFELSDSDAEMCRTAMEKLTDNGRLRPSRWTYQIQTAIRQTPS
jgi:hypothetical protein